MNIALINGKFSASILQKLCQTIHWKSGVNMLCL
jgi:hypothetical protein